MSNNPYAVDFSPLGEAIDKFKKKKHKRKLDTASAALVEGAGTKLAGAKEQAVREGLSYTPSSGLLDDPTALSFGMQDTIQEDPAIMRARENQRIVKGKTAAAKKATDAQELFDTSPMQGLTDDEVKSLTKLKPADRQTVLKDFRQTNTKRRAEEETLRTTKLANDASDLRNDQAQRNVRKDSISDKAARIDHQNQFGGIPILENPLLTSFVQDVFDDEFPEIEGEVTDIVPHMVKGEDGQDKGMVTVFVAGPQGGSQSFDSKVFESLVQIHSLGDANTKSMNTRVQNIDNLQKAITAMPNGEKKWKEVQQNWYSMGKLLGITSKELSQNSYDWIYNTKTKKWEGVATRFGGATGMPETVTYEGKKPTKGGGSGKKTDVSKIPALTEKQVTQQIKSNRSQLKNVVNSKGKLYGAAYAKHKTNLESSIRNTIGRSGEEIKADATLALDALTDLAGAARAKANQSKGKEKKKHLRNYDAFISLKDNLEKEAEIQGQAAKAYGSAAASVEAAASREGAPGTRDLSVQGEGVVPRNAPLSRAGRREDISTQGMPTGTVAPSTKKTPAWKLAYEEEQGMSPREKFNTGQALKRANF